MRQHAIGALAVLLAMLAASPAGAYVLRWREVGGNVRPAFWASSQFPVRFFLNDQPLSLLLNVAGNSDLTSAIEAAMRSWSISPVRVELGGVSPRDSVGADGVSLIAFANTRANRDFVGDSVARTCSWYCTGGCEARMIEADIVASPEAPFATDGAPDARDVQDIMTHELGHALGLGHSPVLDATMYPFGAKGQTLARTLDFDDLAGLQTLYGGAGSAKKGALSGRVFTRRRVSVFGAHVSATDADGIVRAGVVTDLHGAFQIRGLPPGGYQLFVEPLDGPMTPDDLPEYYRDPRRAGLVTQDFVGAFAGGMAASTVRVIAGKTRSVAPIVVEGRSPRLNPQFLGWWENGGPSGGTINRALQIVSGRGGRLVVVGDGLAEVPPNGFRFSGADITIDASQIAYGTAPSGRPFALLPLSVRAEAVPGARNLYCLTPTERAVLAGAIEVITP